MKKYILILIIFSFNIYSQVDSLKDLLNYYPLQNGDYWEYKSYFVQDPFPPTDSSIYSIEVIGDTLMENGKEYKILLNKTIFPNYYQLFQYERMDSSTGCVYRYTNDTTYNHEYLTDSLFAEPGDTIYSTRERITNLGFYRTVCISVVNDTIFGTPTQLKEFYNESFIPGENYTLAKGFGILYSSICEFGCGMTQLYYAKINGEEYGDKIADVNDNKYLLPSTPILNQNYPNPFNSTTVINYTIPFTSNIAIKVYDVLGNEVATLVNEDKPAGDYQIDFNASELSSGVYIYKIQAGSFVSSKKMILLK